MKTSNVRKCTKPLAQRYTAKRVLRQKLNKVNQALLIFKCLCNFWIFDLRNKKNDKTQLRNIHKQTTKNKHNKHTKQTYSQSIGSINAWTCCNAYA